MVELEPVVEVVEPKVEPESMLRTQTRKKYLMNWIVIKQN